MARPTADERYAELVQALSRAAPDELGHIDASRILFVAGAARRESKASIRPLTFGGAPPRFEAGPYVKPRIVIEGALVLYEICLRPRFFLCSHPHERLEILSHELWHISPRFDGTLAEDRRHEAGAPGALEAGVARILAAWDRARAPEVEEVLTWRGELTLRAWLSRPPSRAPRGAPGRLRYGDGDLYPAIVAQR